MSRSTNMTGAAFTLLLLALVSFEIGCQARLLADVQPSLPAPAASVAKTAQVPAPVAPDAANVPKDQPQAPQLPQPVQQAPAAGSSSVVQPQPQLTKEQPPQAVAPVPQKDELQHMLVKSPEQQAAPVVKEPLPLPQQPMEQQQKPSPEVPAPQQIPQEEAKPQVPAGAIIGAPQPQLPQTQLPQTQLPQPQLPLHMQPAPAPGADTKFATEPVLKFGRTLIKTNETTAPRTSPVPPKKKAHKGKKVNKYIEHVLHESEGEPQHPKHYPVIEGPDYEAVEYAPWKHHEAYPEPEHKDMPYETEKVVYFPMPAPLIYDEEPETPKVVVIEPHVPDFHHEVHDHPVFETPEFLLEEDEKVELPLYEHTDVEEEEYDSEGYKPNGYDENGYDRDGYDTEGWNRLGYNRTGYHKEGYNEEGYDIYGYDVEGYDKEGFNVEGYDHMGFDAEGYNKEGKSKEEVYGYHADKPTSYYEDDSHYSMAKEHYTAPEEHYTAPEEHYTAPEDHTIEYPHFTDKKYVEYHLSPVYEEPAHEAVDYVVPQHKLHVARAMPTIGHA